MLIWDWVENIKYFKFDLVENSIHRKKVNLKVNVVE